MELVPFIAMARSSFDSKSSAEDRAIDARGQHGGGSQVWTFHMSKLWTLVCPPPVSFHRLRPPWREGVPKSGQICSSGRSTRRSTAAVGPRRSPPGPCSPRRGTRSGRGKWPLGSWRTRSHGEFGRSARSAPGSSPGHVCSASDRVIEGSKEGRFMSQFYQVLDRRCWMALAGYFLPEKPDPSPS